METLLVTLFWPTEISGADWATASPPIPLPTALEYIGPGYPPPFSLKETTRTSVTQSCLASSSAFVLASAIALPRASFCSWLGSSNVNCSPDTSVAPLPPTPASKSPATVRSRTLMDVVWRTWYPRNTCLPPGQYPPEQAWL